MNHVSLIGRITAVPELRHTHNEKSVANGTLAVDDPYNKERTFWFGFTIWGRNADILCQYIVKGQRLAISGRLTQEEFTPEGSEKVVRKTHVTVESFDFLEKPRGAGSHATNSPPPTRAAAPAAAADPTANTNPDENDEIPF